jgi:hypothetical protein
MMANGETSPNRGKRGKNNSKPPIWEWFTPPIYGDFGGCFMAFFYPHYPGSQFAMDFCFPFADDSPGLLKSLSIPLIPSPEY